MKKARRNPLLATIQTKEKNDLQIHLAKIGKEFGLRLRTVKRNQNKVDGSTWKHISGEISMSRATVRKLIAQLARADEMLNE